MREDAFCTCEKKCQNYLCTGFQLNMSGPSSINNLAAPFRSRPAPVPSDPVPSSSPAFGTPIHPIRPQKATDPVKLSILPVDLPPATLRPLAFRTFTKKHNLTITSSALQIFATFIGKLCGSGWREEGLAERLLDDIARTWKKNRGGVIVPGEGEDLKNILRNIENAMAEGRSGPRNVLNRQASFASGPHESHGKAMTPGELPGVLNRGDSQSSLGISALEVDDDQDADNDGGQPNDPRRWLKIVGAFEQPRLLYNWTQKHFEVIGKPASLLPDPAQKTHLFRHRYNLIHQRLLRNESFQTSTVGASRTNSLQRSSSTITTTQQAYKLTPIANLLGRSGSSHLLLGLLTLSPTGMLTIGDLTGSIALDIQHARPIPEGGAWFTPGMIVLVEGMYEEEGSAAGPGIGGDGGIGGTIGGKFIGFSVGGPPCERRDVTLGVGHSDRAGNLSAGAGFGWVDFLGVGSERASGTNMRRLEQRTLKRALTENSMEGRGRMIIMGQVDLASANVLHALKKVLGTYAAEPLGQSPMIVVLMGNFAKYAVMAGGGSGGSIEYKEYFDSLAIALSEYPSILQSATFIFVPGDNDPWASAFSAGAATALPRPSIPEIFTSRVKRAFATANAEADHSPAKRVEGEAIWSTNPTRLTLFGPAQEVVLFRDDMTGRLLRNALNFRPLEERREPILDESGPPDSSVVSPARNQTQESREMDVDQEVETAESHLPTTKTKDTTNATVSPEANAARRLVKTILDQGYLSPFPLSTRPVLWDYSGALQLYPLPSALVLMDPEAPTFALTYEGCHVMNPGALVSNERRSTAQWMEYDARTRRGKTRETRF